LNVYFAGVGNKKAIDNSCQFLCEIVGLICERMAVSWLSAFGFLLVLCNINQLNQYFNT